MTLQILFSQNLFFFVPLITPKKSSSSINIGWIVFLTRNRVSIGEKNPHHKCPFNAQFFLSTCLSNFICLSLCNTLHYLLWKKEHILEKLLEIYLDFVFLFSLFFVVLCGTCQWKSEKRKTAHIMNILMQYECIREEEKWETVVQSMWVNVNKPYNDNIVIF